MYPDLKVEDMEQEQEQQGFHHDRLRRSSFNHSERVSERSSRSTHERERMMREEEEEEQPQSPSPQRQPERNWRSMLMRNAIDVDTDDDKSDEDFTLSSDDASSLASESEDLRRLINENRVFTRSMESEQMKKAIYHIKLAILFACLIFILIAGISQWDGSNEEQSCWEEFKLLECQLDNPTKDCKKLLECVKEGGQPSDKNTEDDDDDDRWKIIGLCCITVVLIIFIPEKVEFFVHRIADYFIRKFRSRIRRI